MTSKECVRIPDRGGYTTLTTTFIMRVLKLAAIAILNVTPLTSAVEVDRKRSNVQYKSNEEEESAAYIGVAPEDERKLQDDMSMSMAENDMCSFCPDGLDDPAFVLPTDDAATCQEANNFANTLLPNDPSCDTVQLAESFCCKPEPETPEVGTIVDIAAGDDRFTTLVAAVTAAGLVDTLSGDGPFTVFAPTDDAFRALPAGTVEGLLQDVDKLTSVLTYHVVSGKVASTDLVDGPVPTVNGADVTVDLTDGVKINDANVIIPDIEASNGIIHVIDKVLLPPMGKFSCCLELMFVPTYSYPLFFPLHSCVAFLLIKNQTYLCQMLARPLP